MKRFIQSYAVAAIIVAIYAFIKLPVLRLDFLSFISVLIISLISTIVIGYVLGFNKEEQAMIKEKVIRIIRKKLLKR